MAHIPTGQTDDPAAIIVELRRQLSARDDAYEERRAHQAATNDVLQAMSASPGDPQPVFELIATRARDICDGYSVTVYEFDGALLHRRASTGGHEDPTIRGAIQSMYPKAPTRDWPMDRAILDRQLLRIDDYDRDTEMNPEFRRVRPKSGVFLPFLRDGRPLGGISLGRLERGGFSDSQIDLLKTFAEQAVIAITSAETYRALQARTSDLQESLARQTATAEVLGVINASPGNLAPVFDAILDKAMRLCGVAFGNIYTWDGELVHNVAHSGLPAALAEWQASNQVRKPGASAVQVINTRRSRTNLINIDGGPYQEGQPWVRALVDLGGARAVAIVPLVKDETVLGYFHFFRQEPQLFTDKQIALLENFAAQAVIAMENARLITETQEALEQQTATAGVLQVINASPGDLKPVFDAMLGKAIRLSGSAFGTLSTFDGEFFRPAAMYGLTAEHAEALQTPLRPVPGTASGRMLAGEDVVHVADIMASQAYRSGVGYVRAFVDQGGARTAVWVALRKDDKLLGRIVIFRREVRPFTDKQIALLKNFAAQAVIAMENARLITETREALEQQTATAEVLGVINASPGNLAPVFDAMLEKAMRLCGAAFGILNVFDGTRIQAAAMRGLPDAFREYRLSNPPTGLTGTPAEIIATKRPVQRLDVKAGDAYRAGSPGARAIADLGGARTNLGVPLLKDDALLGFFEIYRQEVRAFTDKEIVLLENFAAQAVIAMENARLLNEIRAARDEAETTLTDLRRTQDRLVQTEKMASLGQLTAGIAHEIKNPLNFVNNFSDLSVDLLDELNEAVAPGKIEMPEDTRAEIDEITETLKGNLQKIAQHGRRADSIVKNMLLHSRTGASERRDADLNAVAEEALNLAFHGARAEKQGFNIALERDFDPAVGMVEMYPQEISRVLVNLINNGFYAAHKRAEANPGFEPTLRLSTKNLGDAVEIRVRDNGIGIPPEVRDKIFEPFFTTKPAGEGTGLGLSLSFDIVAKQHGGQLSVASEPGAFTEFTIILPRRLPAGAA